MIDFDRDFYTLLRQIKETFLEAYKHQNYPFEKLVNELNIPRDISRSPLFDYVITLNTEQHHLELGELEVSHFGFDFNMAQFDMSFNFSSFDNLLILNLNYNKDLFKSTTIQRVLENIKRLMKNVLQIPKQPLKNLSFVEQDTQRFRTNSLPKSSILDLFEAQVSKTPNNNAITFYNTNLSYKELDRLSSRVANYLREKHAIQEGDVVSFLLERSELSVISLLAILKVGATFLPLSSTLPKDRIKYILQDSQSKFMITKENLKAALKYKNTQKIQISKALNQLAYIIYTSGTTGHPKGVAVSQKSLLNLCHWYIEDFEINVKTKSLLMIPTSFDASIKNIVAPLLVGGSVTISKEQFDAFDIKTIIEEQKVTLVNCVPSAFKAILDVSKTYQAFKSLKYLALGGEPLDIALFRKFYLQSNCQLFNIYGPTEACDISTVYEVQEEDMYRKNIPIGKAIPNVQIYVLDGFDALAPIGVPGQLVIAGVGLAKGYVHNPELSNESFVEHETLGRIYKTGDLAKLLDNGEIVYLGRDDDQIKIRGNRVELSEIEHKILELKEIESSFVLVKNNTLSAYIKPVQKVKTKMVKEYLENTLPSYMIPIEFIKIKSVPLTANGKVDKKSLLSLQTKVKKESTKNL
ncbi:MAG TPA: amino acid adenylation domain-containing protein, partial [Campylobacterales bacterium]|nr:amino acid adenylation domain-containing protein [Campylobacterales bacterium]